MFAPATGAPDEESTTVPRRTRTWAARGSAPRMNRAPASKPQRARIASSVSCESLQARDVQGHGARDHTQLTHTGVKVNNTTPPARGLSAQRGIELVVRDDTRVDGNGAGACKAQPKRHDRSRRDRARQALEHDMFAAGRERNAAAARHDDQWKHGHLRHA